MITISDAVRQIVQTSAFLEEGLTDGIINCSSLARRIKPNVEDIVYKKVQTGAVIMALKRYSSQLKKIEKRKHIFHGVPDMIVRSHLVEYTFSNSDSLIAKHKKLLEQIHHLRGCFFIITQGVFETTLIVSKDVEHLVKNTFSQEKVFSRFDHLSAITIKLPLETVDTPGVYGWILKCLDWEGINVVEIASTYTEFTLILHENKVDQAFSLLKNRLSQKK